MSESTELLGVQDEKRQEARAARGVEQSVSLQMRFRSLVLDEKHPGRVVFLCAETGMGKTWLAQDVLGLYKSQGRHTRSVDLSGLESAKVCARLTKLAREVTRVTSSAGDAKAVLVDNMPPIEECDLAKVIRALKRMASCSTLVFVCMLPDAESLVEELPDGVKLFSSDLVGLYQVEVESQHVLGTRPSRGIAALCHYGNDARPNAEWHDQEMAWRSAVARVAARLVRSTLPMEEQGLRLAMLLLGYGSFDDLATAVPKLDADVFMWLQRDTPFFGIDLAQGAFSCIGLGVDDVFEHCAPTLREACTALPKTVSMVADVLAKRNDYQRLALVCELCAPQDMAEIACLWGVELVCQGKVTLVRKALLERERLGLERSIPQMLASHAVACLSDQSTFLSEDKLAHGHLDGLVGYERKARLLSLLRASRDLDRGLPPTRMAAVEDGDDPFLRALEKHVKTRRLIMQGKLSEAYGILVNEPLRLDAGSLVAAFLCDDFELCQVLMGELPRERERAAYQRARDLVNGCGIQRIACYQSVLTSMVLALAGRSGTFDGAEEAADRAARMGDDFIRATILLVLAVVDNRHGAYARAHVRALQAVDLVSGTAGRHLILFARLVDALSAMGLGDMGPLNSLAQRVTPSIVRDLAAFMACPDSEAAQQVELSVLSLTNVSRDTAWLLNVLCNDFDSHSATFRGLIPPAWLTLSRRSVRNAQTYARLAGQEEHQLHEGRTASGEERETGGEEFAVDHNSAAGTASAPGTVFVAVLGEFGVMVNGRQMIGSSFTRRRARSLMTVLAVKKGHAMKRFEAIECVWPEADFDSGRQRIYEATSFARNQMVKEAGGLLANPFVGNRSDGLVGFDTAIVSCDVDQFEHLAHAALAEERDMRVIELSRKAMELYRGDLCETPYDATGMVEARRVELRELFVDVSIAGASAAMREDLLPLAVRMAWKAHETNGMREDVVRILVEALKLSGRTIDARNVYLAYARRLLEQTGEPPSASLRALVGKLFPTHRSAGQSVVPRVR